jgi:prepilin-type processing-associated H-X9-DG protein
MANVLFVDSHVETRAGKEIPARQTWPGLLDGAYWNTIFAFGHVIPGQPTISGL